MALSGAERGLSCLSLSMRHCRVASIKPHSFVKIKCSPSDAFRLRCIEALQSRVRQGYEDLSADLIRCKIIDIVA